MRRKKFREVYPEGHDVAFVVQNICFRYFPVGDLHSVVRREDSAPFTLSRRLARSERSAFGGPLFQNLKVGTLRYCNGPTICLGLTIALFGHKKAQCLIRRIKP